MRAEGRSRSPPCVSGGNRRLTGRGGSDRVRGAGEGEAAMPRFSAESLRRMCADAFEAAGFARTDAERVGRLMVESNLTGHDSHGVRHIPVYIERARGGAIDPRGAPRVVSETPATAIVDGGRTLGHLAAGFGMALAVEKARTVRIAAVAVRNNEHVGRVGAYPEMATAAGFVGLTFCNAQGRGISIAAHGGVERRIGANPIAAGFPNPDGDPVLLDISTSQIAMNKIRQARDRGAALPEGALLDEDGAPTTDPGAFMDREGAALPLGGLAFGHKGFGLAVVVDLLCGVIGGSGSAVNSHETKIDNGSFHIVIDPEAFLAREVYDAELRRLAAHLRSSRPLPGVDSVRMPGDFEAENRAERAERGIPVDDAVWDKIRATLARLNVPPPEPL